MWTFINCNVKYIKNPVLLKNTPVCFHLNYSLRNHKKTEEIFINPGILMWYWRWQLIPFKTRKRIDVAVEVISHEPLINPFPHFWKMLRLAFVDTVQKILTKFNLYLCSLLAWSTVSPDKWIINFSALECNKSQRKLSVVHQRNKLYHYRGILIIF